jgi:hypothetical protein
MLIRRTAADSGLTSRDEPQPQTPELKRSIFPTHEDQLAFNKMFSARQKASQYVRRQGVHRALRMASTEHGKTGHHGHHHPGPKTEPLGVRMLV